ncbi:hypothetical protein H9X85_00020 [Anaerotignum lactatifermentans]|uniref:MarR family transcriptional regulator n=2 Tax=Anaerotignum lactatifermentans TaxID=160404 RepID=A0ABS2G716_9FIRM|nr:hypothetical protein [Anaerotignum lactatifermentans]MBM6876825.1 hypothetical protein [Anaerotignum lactatifermentans]MBM6949595.1 hypothetical protein [Anaerotignum lactatifermentans]
MDGMKKAAKQIEDLTKNGSETDLAALSREMGVSQQETEKMILEMEEKGWVSLYEIDLCCSAEYVIQGLTEEGRQALLEQKA